MLRADTSPTTPPDSRPYYYRVRKSWEDKSSQIAACVILQNAKNIADLNEGYSVFDEDGKCVYGLAMEQQTFTPYPVRITIPDLNYRHGPNTSYPSWGYIPVGVYTIVDEQDGWGLLKAYAQNRNGWIKLSYAQKL